MPSTTILKPDPDQDFYVVWLNGVDGPGAWGTRARVVDVLTRPGSVFGERDADPERFERADATGTSEVGGCFEGMVVEGQAWMPRAKMVAWCRSGLDRAMLELSVDQRRDRRRAAAAEAADSYP